MFRVISTARILNPVLNSYSILETYYFKTKTFHHTVLRRSV